MEVIVKERDSVKEEHLYEYYIIYVYNGGGCIFVSIVPI